MNYNKEKSNKNSITIFNYINPCSNDMISKMSSEELRKLIVLLNNYYIKLRSNIGIKEYVTFGLEIEFENAKRDKIEKNLHQYFSNSGWQIKDDISLNNGAEITSPILNDNSTSWLNLKKICNIITKYANIDENAGAHIHIGTQTLGKENKSWLNFFKLWSTYENIIFRFAYGEFLSARPSILEFSKPVSKEFEKLYNKLLNEETDIKDLITDITQEKYTYDETITIRYKAVNLSNVNINNTNGNIVTMKNTIEFRCPNGTLNPVIWQNNVNLFVKMLEYCKSNKFDEEVINNRKKKQITYCDELKLYNQIYLEQSLEFIDLIFANNIDKINFLKQYLKSFEVKNRNYTKIKNITKRGIII